MKIDELLQLLRGLFDRGTGSEAETTHFEGMNHDTLVATFVDYLNQHRHYLPICSIDPSHALNDKGVDVILRTGNLAIGFQIKSPFDVIEDDFAANVKRQYTESKSHGLSHYFIIICSQLGKIEPTKGKSTKRIDVNQKVNHLLNELSQLQTDYHTVYGPLNSVRLFKNLPVIERDQLLIKGAIKGDCLREHEKGIEHLPELIENDELRAAKNEWERLEDFWPDDAQAVAAQDKYIKLAKKMWADYFNNVFLPTIPPAIREQRSQLIESAKSSLEQCRSCKSWGDRSELKLPQWINYVEEDMIPFTSLPNLLQIADSLKKYLEVHRKEDNGVID